MDDFMQKIQDVLSDEESMKQIEELAQMFGAQNTDENNNSADSDSGINMGSIAVLGELLKSANTSDKNTELLRALKPLLKEEKQHKVDKAIKILKLVAIYTAVKESGTLNEFLE